MDKFDNIPQELRDRAQWLVWKLEHIEGKAKPAKLPHNARTGWKIDPTDKAGLSTFEKAVAAARTGKFDGIGYSFQPDDPYCGIDLDHSENQWIVERQNVIFDKIVSYTEISPSGNGAHIIVRGEIPIGLKTDIAELYSKERYLTFTGDVVRDEPIKFVNGALGELYDELRAYQATNSKARVSLDEFESKLTDEQVCTAAEQMTDGRFGLLWETAKSNSEKDMSFFVMLANAGADPLQAKRIFLAAPIGASVTRKGSAKTIENYLMVQTLPKAFNDVVKLLDLTAFIASGQAYLDKKRTARKQADELRAKRARETRQQEADALRERVALRLAESDIHKANWSSSPHSFAPVIAHGDAFPIPPGYFGSVYKFFMDQSPYPIDGICLGAALCFVATLSGRAHNVSGEGLNTFVLALAPTAAGKEGGNTGVSKLVQALSPQFRQIEDMFKPRQPNSAGGLINDLDKSNSVMYSISEFWSHFIKLTGPRASAHDEQLKSAYMEFYTKSGFGKRAGGSSYSDRGKNAAVIDSPNLSLFCESVATRFYDTLSEQSFSDGFAPRFVIFECENIPIDDNEQAYHVYPDSMLTGVLSNMLAKSLDYQRRLDVCNVIFTIDAEIKSKAYKRCVREWFSTGSELRREVWSRAHMKAVKLAALLAVTDACANHAEPVYAPTVTLEMLDWAISIVNHSTSRVEDHLSSGEFGEGDLKAIADAKRYLVRYVTEQGAQLKVGTHFNAALHADKVIGMSHWKASVSTNSFRKASIGAVGMWARVVMALRSEGVLVKLDQDHVLERYKFYGEAFGINAGMLA